VSTSGWAFKYPGRVGDSPVIGAGNYCDNRYGACACTGMGELAIRAGTAHSVVLALAAGASPGDACLRAFADLRLLPFPPGIDARMNLVLLTAQGEHAAYSTHSDAKYVWQTAAMETYATAERTMA
jgi:beta-aspartyl-peptidase (threonine type)